MSDSVIRDAIKLRDALLQVAKEIETRAETDKALRRSSKTAQELALMDSRTCIEAAQMLQVLGTEVTRLREGIGLHHYGQLAERRLDWMAQNWNGRTSEEVLAEISHE